MPPRNVWFTADLHFGHFNMTAAEGSKNLCNRPFNSVEEMDEALVTYWNEWVGPRDLIYVLGDVAMGKRSETLQNVSKLKGEKRLVSGNHDKCWGHGREAKKPEKWKKMQELYLEAGFVSILDSNATYIDKNFTMLSHFPYKGDSHEVDRYVEARLTDQGAWLIHGHVHDAWLQRGHQINAGVDVWDYHPVHMDTITQLMRAGNRNLDTRPEEMMVI